MPAVPGVDSIVEVNLSGDSAPEMQIYINNHVFNELLNIDFIL